MLNHYCCRACNYGIVVVVHVRFGVVALVRVGRDVEIHGEQR